MIVDLLISLFLILSFSSASAGQTPSKPIPKQLYAGIELNPDGVRAVVLRNSNDDETPGMRLVYSETIRAVIVPARGGEYSQQTVNSAVQAVQKLLKRVREEQVPENRIYLIGGNALDVERSGSLLGAIRKVAGKTMTILDAQTDVQLSIAGTIPQRDQAGETMIDVRNSSMLVEIGPVSTRAGYQMLKYLPPSPPRYEFVTMNVPQGVETLTQDILGGLAGRAASLTEFTQQTRSLAATSFKTALQKERENKPGLLTRKRVYLSGDIVWALTILMLPQERGSFVVITPEQITMFAKRAMKDPAGLLNPELTQIRDRKLRLEVERELAEVRQALTPLQLVAGAEMLKTVAAEFNFEEKNLLYARYGHLSRLVSYLGLQFER